MIRYCLVIITISCLLSCATTGTQNRMDQSDEEMNSGLFYCDDLVFGLTAPEGWVLDDVSGSSLGLDAVFYPEKTSWKKTTMDMYVNVVDKKNGGEETIEELILRDISRFKDESPDLIVEDAPEPFLTRDGERVIVKYFKNSARWKYEAVAYIDEDKKVVLLVFGSDTAEEFKASLGSFEELVSSYIYMNMKPLIPE